MHMRHTLREARRMRGWTQKQAARQVGVSRRTWEAWEYGVRTPSLRHARRVAEVLGLPIERLFD